jgi:hypothetical protein
MLSQIAQPVGFFGSHAQISAFERYNYVMYTHTHIGEVAEPRVSTS